MNASFANLKYWSPSGMPIIVQQQTIPIVAQYTAFSQPSNKIHSRFAIKLGAPPPNFMSLPNGAADRRANLKHCLPSGMPTTVI